MAKSIEEKIFSKIRSNRPGCAFSRKDFAETFAPENIDVALSRLAAKGKIRRLGRGLYDYPREGQFIKEQMGPDMDQVAHALARKFGWRILPNSETALNALGLSTQTPGRWVYLSDGPNRKVTIGKTELQFKQTSLQLAGLEHMPTALTVLALKALGQNRVDASVIRKIQSHWDASQKTRMLKEAKHQTAWVYECIKDIAGDREHG